MTIRSRSLLVTVTAGSVLAVTMAVPVFAQSQPKSELGTSYVSIFAGGARTSTHIAPATGLNLGVQLARRVTLEGRGRWFDAPAGDDAFAADLGIRYSVAPTTFARPYVSGGVGVFESYFSHVTDTTPSFYRQRMDATDVARGFHDMLWTVGGGADLFVTRHVALRPEIGLFITTTQHDARVVPAFGVSLAYFFDSQTSLSRQH